MKSEGDCRSQLEREAQVLIGQKDRLIVQLGVDVMGTEKFLKYPQPLRQIAAGYEQLAKAERNSGRVKWDQTNVNGRNGDEMMRRLWAVREGLRSLT